MESLIASYASSDSEGDDGEARASPTSLSASPPASKSTSLFASLPPPQKRAPIAESHGLFGSLPAPKKNKRPVVFRPPIDMSVLAKDDEEQRPGTSEQQPEQSMEIITPGLVLPAPKNTSLGIGAASGRRAQVVHVATSVSIDQQAETDDNAQAPNYEAVPYEQQMYENDLWHQQQQPSADTAQMWQTQDEEDPVAKALKQERRRGRDEPVTFVEIKQEDLTRNRPREDQLRMTGIAFGTAFENKEDAENKPSKLHKRKHQIGSLLYDMKQKEFELMERRARGQMSKAQTQAKYGW